MKREDIDKEIELHVEGICKRLVGKCIVRVISKESSIYAPVEYIHAMKVLDYYIKDDLCHLIGIDKDGMAIPLECISSIVIDGGWCRINTADGGMVIYALWDELINGLINYNIDERY